MPSGRLSLSLMLMLGNIRALVEGNPATATATTAAMATATILDSRCFCLCFCFCLWFIHPPAV